MVFISFFDVFVFLGSAELPVLKYFRISSGDIAANFLDNSVRRSRWNLTASNVFVFADIVSILTFPSDLILNHLPLLSASHNLVNVLFPVVQDRRVKIRAVRPNDGVHFLVNHHSIEERHFF